MENNININAIEFSLGYVIILVTTRTSTRTRISAHLCAHMPYVHPSFFASTLNTAYLDFAETGFQYKRDFIRKFNFPLVKKKYYCKLQHRGPWDLDVILSKPFTIYYN